VALNKLHPISPEISSDMNIDTLSYTEDVFGPQETASLSSRNLNVALKNNLPLIKKSRKWL
jgi:hypothetical protein